MKNYVALLKVFFKQKYGKDTTSSSKYMWIAYIIIGLAAAALIVGLCALVYFLAPHFDAEGRLSELILIVMAVLCLIVIMLGLVSTISFVYFNRDTEFLAGLAIKPTTIFLAKMSVVYIEEVIFSAAAILPIMLCIGISTSMSPIFYVAIPLLILAGPAFPFLIVSILSVPMMYLVSFFKSRGAASTVMLVLLFAAFFAVYFLLIGNVSEGDESNVDWDEIMRSIFTFTEKLRYILYPLYALASFATLQSFNGLDTVPSAFIHLGIGIGIFAAIFVVSYVLSALFYYRGVSAQLENKKAKIAVGGSYNQSTPVKALMKKEFNEIIRTPSVGFQCLSGLIICPLFVLLFVGGLFGNMMEDEIGSEVLGYLTIFIATMMIMVMGVSLNQAAATCLSREGKNFYYMKILPVSYRAMIRAKKNLYFTMSMLTMVLSYICLCFVFDNFLLILLSFGMVCIYDYAYICFAMRNDINNPNLNWTAVTEVMKRSKNATIPALANMGISIVLIGIATALSVVFSEFFAAQIVIWVVLYVISIGLAVGAHVMLNHNLEYKLETIE